MERTESSGRATPPLRVIVSAVLALALASIGLAACGGSSKSSTTTNASVAATSGGSGTGASGPTGPAGSRSDRFKGIKECLQKNGITLPKPSSGQRRPGGSGGFLGGAGGAGGSPKLPAGVTRAQYEAALKKCGGGAFGRTRGRFNSPAFKQSLDKFASCMRENGVNVPEPDTSGKGPIFSTKGIDTASAQFKAAEAKCSKDLHETFRPHPGYAPGGPPPGGAAAG